MKKVVVLSLGGSLIMPEKTDVDFLKKFKKTIRRNYKNYKFVVVCGGGIVARKYISALREQGKSERELSLAGIRATRMNAMLVMQIFGKEANDKLPKDMKDVKNNLRKNKIVICGALRYNDKATSDTTSAKLSCYLKCEFINLTNIKGLYNKNPLTYKSAKFIPKIRWGEFRKMADKIKFRAGQHFVLDQGAAHIIEEHKIKTYIIGRRLENLDKILGGKKFVGTIISG